jgi:hypothetical protein
LSVKSPVHFPSFPYATRTACVIKRNIPGYFLN